MFHRFLLPLLMVVFAIFLIEEAKAQSAVAVDARLGGDVFRTRLIVDITKKVKFRTFTLANPYRLIIDMPNVNFQMPENTGNLGRGVVSAFRYGLFGRGKSRIVVDLNQPAAVEKAYSLEPRQGQPGKLVIDLIPVDRETFVSKQELARQQRLAELAKKKKRRKLFQVTPDDPLSLNNTPKKVGEKPVIVIDPGHGGLDSGAQGVSGSREKNIVLAFGKTLRAELAQRNKYKIRMTRSTDVFIPLTGRVKFARKRKADLFVSIHADSIKRKDPTVRGATVYTLSEKASDDEARAFAQSENRSDVLAGVDVSSQSTTVTNILYSLAKRETKNHSVAFASILIDSIKGSTIVKKNPIRYANFVVLRAPDVPSVLVELGYMSSAKDEQLLKSPEWRKKVAKSVATAIDQYFKKRRAPNTF
ncbi:MAG: N-acetylmuramoyl-L-alanine amidase [Methyloligellaceae bacterium]